MTIEIMRTTSAAAPSDVGGLADAVLVDLARQGREDAVRTLVQRHNRRLFRVARGIVRDDAEAEDIVQETYVRAFTHLTTFRGAAELATWLTRIAHERGARPPPPPPAAAPTSPSSRPPVPTTPG